MALKDVIEEMAKNREPRIKFYRIDEGDVVQGKFGKERKEDFSPVEMRRIVKVLQAAIETADTHAEHEPNRRDKANYNHMAQDFEDILREARHGNRSHAIKIFKTLESDALDVLDDVVGSNGKTVFSYFNHRSTPRPQIRNKFTTDEE